VLHAPYSRPPPTFGSKPTSRANPDTRSASSPGRWIGQQWLPSHQPIREWGIASRNRRAHEGGSAWSLRPQRIKVGARTSRDTTS
jgi:hypothetical protein